MKLVFCFQITVLTSCVEYKKNNKITFNNDFLCLNLRLLTGLPNLQ